MFLKAFFITCMGLSSLLLGVDPAPFATTIPVVDLADFHHPETKDRFVQEVAKAMHEVGFFGVIHPEIDADTLNSAYSASAQFFSSPQELKDTLCDPLLNGQRGYVKSEIAQGNTVLDFKEFCHIGKYKNLWPFWMDMQSPMEKLMAVLDKNAETLDRAFALALGLDEEYFLNMTREGECLLRPIHYPPNPAPGYVWAAKHTDIDFFTILPMATEEGLQVFHNGEWIDVRVPDNAFIINCGDKLQNLSNGYFKSSVHQVMAKPNVERYSIVYFVHPRDNDDMAPIPEAIALTGGVQRYPQATSLELLASRLRELSLASPDLLQFEKDSGVMERIQTLVESGNAAEPVELTYSIWQKQKDPS
jgi:isopenicillin N synthase-like dioxygenase